MKRSFSIEDDPPNRKNNLLKLLKVIEENGDTVDFNAFIELFRRQPKNKLPIPIKNLTIWQQKYPDEIYVIRNSTTQQLELCIDRIALMKRHRVPLKVMQCFERCLMSVKPKLAVIQTTHGHAIKKFTLQ